MRIGIAGFQPERLTQMREARGLTKINLGRLVNRSPSTLTKWENGSHSPDAEAISRLSEVLNCSMNWFMKGTVKGKNAKPVFFRTLQSTAKDLRVSSERYMEWLQEVSILLQEYLDFPAVDIPAASVNDCRAIDDDFIEEKAAECRKLWGLKNAPIQNLLLIIENAGVICSQFEQGSTMMDGYSQWSEHEGRPYIILATDKNNYYRSRFDAAHELGHIVLHRYIEQLDSTNFNLIEEQANKFASCFMLPEEAFSSELPSYPTLENFTSLKSRWGMSIQSMIMRAKDLELISQLEYQRLYKSLSSRGWRKSEPLDDSKIPETVRLLPRSVNILLESRIFSKQTLLDYLGHKSCDAEDLFSLPRSYLTDTPILDFESKVRIKNSMVVPEITKQHNVVNFFKK